MELQLCRPFSGAVTRRASIASCTPIFCFNYAAPFQERLRGTQGWWTPETLALQLCRPFSGAVTLLVYFIRFDMLFLRRFAMLLPLFSSCLPMYAFCVKSCRYGVLREVIPVLLIILPLAGLGCLGIALSLGSQASVLIVSG